MPARSPLVLGMSGPQVIPTGDYIPIEDGGTGAGDAAGARAALGIPSATNPVFGGTAAVIPNRTTAQRAASPAPGTLAYNSTIGRFECYSAVRGWFPFDGGWISRYRGSVAQTTGTSVTALSNNAPLVTEGTQLWTFTLTPVTIGGTVMIDFSGMVATSVTTATITIAIYRGSTLLGFTQLSSSNANGTSPSNFYLRCTDTTTSTANITYTCRIGATSGTWYLGRPSSVTSGGVNNSVWTVTEELT